MTLGAKLSTAENYTIGAIVGLIDVVVTNPFFVIKLKLQQGAPIPWNIRGLYKGFTINALGFVPITTIQIGSYQWIEKHFYSTKPTYKETINAAFTAGVLSSVLACPVEMIMTQQNNTPHLNFIQATKQQIQTRGVSSLFTGLLATALREGSFSVFFLAITPLLKDKIKPYCDNNLIATTLAGISSGMSAAILSQPIDVIKTIQQSQNQQGFFQTAKQLQKADLFKGLFSRASSIVISVTVMNWLKERLESYCVEQNELAITNNRAIK